MKAKAIFTVMGLAAFMACKKVKVEPVTPVEKSDTVVTKPAYWCVKSAVIKRTGFPERHFEFNYNSNSQITSIREYPDNSTSTSGLLYIHTFLTSFTYKDDKLVYKKIEKSTGEKLEEFRTYENGNLIKKEVKGSLFYYSEDFFPSVTDYLYTGTSISTKTRYQYYINNVIDTGTVTTSFKDYPDSSVAESHHYEAATYFKEKLIKNKGTISVYEPPTTWVSYDPSSIANNSDSIVLNQQENRFNPIVWDYLNIYPFYDAISAYHIYPVLLDLSHNKKFVDSRGLKNKLAYKYQYDAENRVVSIKLVNSDYEITFTY